MSGPRSPDVSLRRRSRAGSASAFAAAGPSSQPKQPHAAEHRQAGLMSPESIAEATAAAVGDDDAVRKPSHLRKKSDGFGSFVDAGGASSSADDPWGPMTTSQSSEEDDEWHDAALVESFSPPNSTGPAVAELPDWDAWDSRGPSKVATPGGMSLSGSTLLSGGGPSRAVNPADDEFFAAFERAAVEANARAPSPPVIDLRPVERKLDAARGKAPAPSAVENDFFAQFERADSMPKRKEAPGLLGDALDEMTEARTSPMEVRPSPGQHRAPQDYFGDDAEAKQQVGSPIEEPGSWTGSLKRTWGSIRGLPAGLVEHLPSAADFIVPPNDEDDKERRGSASSSTSHNAPPPPPPRKSSGSTSKFARPAIPHASDYSHSSPFGASSPPGVAPHQLSKSFGNGGASRFSASQPSMPIAGAPGFDISNERRWNTGSWSMTSQGEQARSRRPIEVTMKGRSASTDAVLGQWHASRIQASLPPRSQLGRTWKLLYSLDQHGISLSTLYANVAAGLTQDSEAAAAADLGGGGLENAEGWMRGASSAAKAAMRTNTGSRLKHVGGGLELSDAGIVIAIQDTDDNVFGAYINERLRPQSHYYGSGECFLWKTTRSETAAADGDDRALRVFRWTGANDYVVLTEAHYLSVGGGNSGRYGLWLDGKLEKGVSARSSTFDNNVLCDDSPTCSEDGKEGHFECLGLEVWAVGID